MGGQFPAPGVLLHRGYGTVAKGIRGRSFCKELILPVSYHQGYRAVFYWVSHGQRLYS
jgi:hypothetical protein